MKGFTLIELIVVIAIMAILTVIAVPSYNEYSRNQKLNDAASGLQTTLRQAQNNAQTGTVCSDSSKADYWYIELPLYGTQYFIGPHCGSGQTSSSIPLPSGVTISGISVDGCLIDTSVKVQFNNITSNVSFKDLGSGCTDSTNSNLEITLSLTGSPSKTIRVEKGGGIYVKQ